MQDIIYVGAIALFFPVAFLFMAACDRLMGSEKANVSRLARPARATQKVRMQPHQEKATAA